MISREQIITSVVGAAFLFERTVIGVSAAGPDLNPETAVVGTVSCLGVLLLGSLAWHLTRVSSRRSVSPKEIDSLREPEHNSLFLMDRIQRLADLRDRLDNHRSIDGLPNPKDGLSPSEKDFIDTYGYSTEIPDLLEFTQGHDLYKDSYRRWLNEKYHPTMADVKNAERAANFYTDNLAKESNDIANHAYEVAQAARRDVRDLRQKLQK